MRSHLYKQSSSPGLGRQLLPEYLLQWALWFDRCFDTEKYCNTCKGAQLWNQSHRSLDVPSPPLHLADQDRLHPITDFYVILL